MKFPYAAKGVKKIFIAELLMLIAAILSVIGIILAVVSIAAGETASNGALAAGISTIMCLTAAAVLSMIAWILSLAGIINAAKDETTFRYALFAVLVSLVAAVVSAIFSSNDTVQSICQTIGNAMNILVTVFVIKGITVLADKLNNAEVSRKGRTLLTIIVVIYVLSFIASLIALIVGGMYVSVFAAVLSIAALILDIVAYVIYLSLLSKGKSMLEE